MQAFDYATARSIEEAVSLLSKHDGQAYIYLSLCRGPVKHWPDDRSLTKPSKRQPRSHGMRLARSATCGAVRQAIENLEKSLPGIQARLCESGWLRPNISAVVDSLVSQQGLCQQLAERSEVHFLPAMSGG